MAQLPKKSYMLPDDLYTYLCEVSIREPEVMARVRETTSLRPNHGLQIGPEQGHFMGWLVRLIQAKRCLEVGVFTGYSALAVALNLPPDGHITACELNEEYAREAQANWRDAGVADRIELRLGPGVESLDTLLAEGAAGTYDFAFIDANKGDYPTYLDRCTRLVRTGGLIAIDNVLWQGGVYQGLKDDDTDGRVIQKLNAAISEDARLDPWLMPLSDGIFLCRVR